MPTILHFTCPSPALLNKARPYLSEMCNPLWLQLHHHLKSDEGFSKEAFEELPFLEEQGDKSSAIIVWA